MSVLWNSLKNSFESKLIRFGIKILGILFVVWYFVSGLYLWVESGSIINNTLSLSEESNRILVSEISEDTIRLSTGKSLDIDDINAYVRTAPGSLVYLLSDTSDLAAPITLVQCMLLGVEFYTLGLIVFAVLVLWIRSRKLAGKTKHYAVQCLAIVIAGFSVFVSTFYSYIYNWYNVTYSRVFFFVLIGLSVGLGILCSVYVRRGVVS